MALNDRVSSRMLARHGDSVTLRNYENSGDNDWGEVWVEAADSPKTVTAVVQSPTRPGQPVNKEYAAGELPYTAMIYVSADVTGIRDGGGEGASEIDVETASGTQTYYVEQADPTDRGIVRLRCTRED